MKEVVDEAQLLPRWSETEGEAALGQRRRSGSSSLLALPAGRRRGRRE